jgi:hypothetical protein
MLLATFVFQRQVAIDATNPCNVCCYGHFRERVSIESLDAPESTTIPFIASICIHSYAFTKSYQQHPLRFSHLVLSLERARLTLQPTTSTMTATSPAEDKKPVVIQEIQKQVLSTSLGLINVSFCQNTGF